MFYDLPLPERESLRARFVNDAVGISALSMSDLLAQFLMEPHIAEQWERYLDKAWNDLMSNPDLEQHWYDWLRAHDIDP